MVLAAIVRIIPYFVARERSDQVQKFSRVSFALFSFLLAIRKPMHTRRLVSERRSGDTFQALKLKPKKEGLFSKLKLQNSYTWKSDKSFKIGKNAFRNAI